MRNNHRDYLSLLRTGGFFMYNYDKSLSEIENAKGRKLTKDETIKFNREWNMMIADSISDIQNENFINEVIIVLENPNVKPRPVVKSL